MSESIASRVRSREKNVTAQLAFRITQFRISGHAMAPEMSRVGLATSVKPTKAFIDTCRVFFLWRFIKWIAMINYPRSQIVSSVTGWRDDSVKNL